MRVSANGIGIEVRVDGPADGRPLLMIMGLGMQLVGWPEGFVQVLVRRGFRVVRFDNRDAGLSDGFDALGVPPMVPTMLRYWLRMPVHPPYTVADMATDAVGVLDALGIAGADVCGASMGGMVAQHVAARHPERVKALTLMMTTTGARHLPSPRPAVQRALMARPHGTSREAIVDQLERTMRLIGSPAYPEPADALRARLAAAVTRAWRPAGTARQLVAIVADGDRSALVRRIGAPSAIVHGRADALVPVAAAADLAGCLPQAFVDLIDGMGHDLPAPLWPRFADAIEGVAKRAGGA